MQAGQVDQERSGPPKEMQGGVEGWQSNLKRPAHGAGWIEVTSGSVLHRPPTLSTDGRGCLQESLADRVPGNVTAEPQHPFSKQKEHW